MSDYFTRLAERSLKATPLPRPAIPSRFERPSASGFDEVDLEAVAPRAEGAHTIAAVPGAPAAAADMTVEPRPITAPATDPALPRASDSVDHPADTAPQAERAPSFAGNATFVERVVTHERDHVLVERDAVVAPAPATPQPLPAHVAPPPPRIETQLVAPSSFALESPAERQPARDTAEPAVIHVTIGRIDVRAVNAPPPSRERPHPQRPARPSLEDYLRRGGTRP